MSKWKINNVNNSDKELNKSDRYRNNRKISKELKGYIFSQNNRPVKSLSFGRRYTVGKNGCGAVAIYNAMRALGKPMDFSDIIFEMEQNRMLRFGGLLGTSPVKIPRFFKEHGVNCTVIESYEEFTNRAGEFTASVIFMREENSFVQHYYCVIMHWTGVLYSLNLNNSKGFGKVNLNKPLKHKFLRAFCLK